MPRFVHTPCKNCTSLGEHEEFDLYHCLQSNKVPTLLARYGDSGQDYLSGLHSPIAPLVEAQKRAAALGLKIKY